MNGVRAFWVAVPTAVSAGVRPVTAWIRLRRDRRGERCPPSRRDPRLRRSDVVGRRRSRGGVQGGEPVRCQLPDRAAVADRCGRHVEPRDPDLGRRRRLRRAGFRHVSGGRVRRPSARPCPRRPGGRRADTGGCGRPGRVDLHRGVRPCRRGPPRRQARDHALAGRARARRLVSDVPRRARRDLRSRWHHVHVGRGDGRHRSGARSRRRGPRARPGARRRPRLGGVHAACGRPVSVLGTAARTPAPLAGSPRNHRLRDGEPSRGLLAR